MWEHPAVPPVHCNWGTAAVRRAVVYCPLWRVSACTSRSRTFPETGGTKVNICPDDTEASFQDKADDTKDTTACLFKRRSLQKHQGLREEHSRVPRPLGGDLGYSSQNVQTPKIAQGDYYALQDNLKRAKTKKPSWYRLRASPSPHQAAANRQNPPRRHNDGRHARSN